MTPKRLRAHGLVISLCLWSVYVSNMATPGLRDRAPNLKGTDFLHFYTLGSLALAHRGTDLYNCKRNQNSRRSGFRPPLASDTCRSIHLRFQLSSRRLPDYLIPECCSGSL